MAQSSPESVADYLSALPAERRAVLAAVRAVVRKHLPAGYREVMNWGMITYEIPLARYPDTYNGRPLCYVALAAQKSHYALYLTNVYQDPALAALLKEGFEKAGKKLDMGKSCLRFQHLDDLELEVIGQLVAGTSPEAFIARHEASRSPAARGDKAARPRAKVAASRRSAKPSVRGGAA